MEENIQDSYDSIGIFLSAHVVYRYQSIMSKRNVPALNRFDLLRQEANFFLQMNFMARVKNTIIDAFFFWVCFFVKGDHDSFLAAYVSDIGTPS